MNDVPTGDPAHSRHTPDVLARLKTALARSCGGVEDGLPFARAILETSLMRRNRLKRLLLRDAIAEIERLRAVEDAARGACTRHHPQPVIQTLAALAAHRAGAAR